MTFVPPFLERLGAGYRLGLAASLFAVMVAVDVAAGRELSLTPFYLVAVLFTVWSAGMIWGSVFLAASLFATVTLGEIYGHPFISRGLFYVDVAGRFVVYVIVLLVAGVAREAHAREQALARSDSLTGLANRTALYERIGIEIERQKRGGRSMTLAYIDCDDFKRVNDRYGHAAGDRLLRDVAHALVQSVRRIDMPARIGGDEFALLLPETEAREASVVIDKVRSALRELPHASAGTVGFSVGVVVARTAPLSVDWLIDQADRLMFSVKRAGKNAVKELVVDPLPESKAQSAGDASAAKADAP
jgi:diguanylate cyclase (GGDEF)-like protein